LECEQEFKIETMTIKSLLFGSLLCACSNWIFGQNGVGWLVEESLTDSLAVKNLSFHTTLKPAIRQKVNTDKQFSMSEKAGIIPLMDIGAQWANGLYYRGGLGAALECEPFKKAYLRLGALGLYGNQTSTFQPFYFSEPISNIFWQPLARFSYTPNSIFNFQLGADENFIEIGRAHV